MQKFNSRIHVVAFFVTMLASALVGVHARSSFDVREDASVLIPQATAISAPKAVAAAGSVHTYVPASKMKSGEWVKMQIPESGIYKVTYQDIVSQGLDPNDVQIYGYGGAIINEDFTTAPPDDLPQVPVYVEKGEDGVFGDGDYMLFYAQGTVSWTYNTGGFYEHTPNPYSLNGCYFLASGVTDASLHTMQKRPKPEIPAGAATTVSFFNGRYFHEKDIINLVASDWRKGSGREWYGEEFNNTARSKTISFSIPNVVQGSEVRLAFNGAMFSSTSTGATSSFNVEAGGAEKTFSAANIKPVDVTHSYGTTASGTMTYTATSAQQNVAVTLVPAVGAPTAKGWLNYIELTALRELIMNGKEMYFGNAGFETMQYPQYVLREASPAIKIWEITDPTTVSEIDATYNASTKELTFELDNTDGLVREFVAVDMSNSFASPTMVGEVANQDLHGLSNPTFVIISHPDFLEQANRLAQAHNEKDNMDVLIVTQEQVFNEFSSGTSDASAIRRFMKMFYDRKQIDNTQKETKYLLLFGDGSYDNRQIAGQPDQQNKIITFQSKLSLVETSSYVTDDYFGFLDNNEGISLGADKLDIAIGRFPVNTVEEANAVVDKTIRYMENANKGNWKNQICYLADDVDTRNDSRHQQDADELANKMMLQQPGFQITKLYLDAYKQQTTASGEFYPEVKDKLHNQIRKGLLMLNYIGHGGVNGLTNEQMLLINDIKNMYNDNLALWVTATCDFSRFDSGIETAGEEALLNPHGGSIALFTTTRTVYAANNYALNSAFINHVFSKDESGVRLRMGEIIKTTKLDLTFDSNKLSFTLLGDPALLLPYPALNVETDSINGQDATGDPQTMEALGKVTIKGHIADDTGLLQSDFNGVVTITLFDKEESITTLNNGNMPVNVFTFKDRPVIYSGKAQVENGHFAITLMLPKDINYTTGSGKILYYAYDEGRDDEAHGDFENVLIGGSSEEIITDNEGPSINMYLNTPDFKSGQKVNSSPLFIAHVADEHGINITGTGIGHDITIMLDNSEWINLNDYFDPTTGSYQDGTVTYKLANLPEGRHTLTFRVWDLLNNSSTSSVEFEVSNEALIGITDAYCYPNPAATSTVFVLQHDRPEEAIQATIHVYDLTGREVWSFSSDYYSTGNLMELTEWDLHTNSGSQVRNGIYMFKLDVRTPSGKMSTKTKKIIINTQ